MVFSAEDYLSAIRENSPATTKEVAEAVGVTRQGADYRLARLEEEGLVEKQVFGRTYVWTVAEERERAETPPDPAPDESPAPEEPPREREQERREPTPEDEPGEPDTLEAEIDAVHSALGDVEFPGRRDRAGCVAAIHAAREHIQEHGGATKKEIVREIMPGHPLGYDVDKALEQVDDPDARFRGAWWRHIVKPGLEALPDVEKPKPGASEWRYVGED